MGRRLFCLLALIVVVTLGAGCAKMPQRSDYVKEDVPPTMTADAEHGLIYFFREWAFGGGGVSYFVQEDTKNIGLLKAGSYFSYKSKPGKHTYASETESKSSVTLDIQAGQTYYVEGGIGIGFWAGVPKLSEVTKPVFDKAKPDLKYIRLATPEESEAIKAKESKPESGVSIGG